MGRTIVSGVFGRFIVFYVLWPMITVALGAMGLTPDWLWALLLGPDWKEVVPTYLTQDNARWALVIFAAVSGFGFIVYSLWWKHPARALNDVTARSSEADLIRAQAELERQKRLTLKEQRAAAKMATPPVKEVTKTITMRAADFRPSKLSGADWNDDRSALAFDTSVQEFAECEIELPEWAQEKIQMRVNWSHDATTTNFSTVFGLNGKILAGQSTPFELATVTGETTTTERQWTAWSEPKEFPMVLPGDLYALILYRAVSDLRDTLMGDAIVHAIQIRPEQQIDANLVLASQMFGRR